jgi:PAS domain S-box-containing protein
MDGFVQVSMDGSIQDTNEVYRRMVGYSAKELRRLTYVQLTPERWRAFEARIVEDQILPRGYSDVYEKEYRRKDGSVVPVELRTFLLREHGRPAGMWAIVRDVTSRKQTDAALAASEALFRVAFDDAAVGLALMGLDGRPLRVNRAICEMLGYRPDELMSIRWMDVTHPEDIAATSVMLHDTLASREGRGQLRKRYLHRDGSVVWADLRMSVVHDASGNPVHLIASAVNVTARKRAEDALEASRTLFRTLAEEAPVGIFLTDIRGDVVYANPACGRIVGWPTEVAKGTGWLQAVHPEDRERALREWTEAHSAGRTYANEFRFQRPMGETVWVRIFGASLRDATGTVTGYVGVVEDVTEARALQGQVALTARLAALGALLSGVANEINNPLAGGLAAGSLAIDDLEKLGDRLRGDDPIDRSAATRQVDRALDALRRSQEESLRVADLVRDLNLFGQPAAERERVRLADRLASVLGVLGPSLPQGVTVRVEDQGVPDIIGSPLQLDRALATLISNAVRTPRDGTGGVVTVRLDRGGTGTARVELTLHGAGRAADRLERVFEPFYVPGAPGGSTGLGLPVAHAIVVAHGGTLTAHAAPDGGATFRMELPAAPDAG